MIDQALANAAVGRTEPVRMFELLAWCRQQAVARGLKPVESHLLLTLATYCDDEATCWPSIKRLAADMGYRTTKAGTSSVISSAMRELEDKGLVWSRQRGKGRAAKRELLFNPLLSVMPDSRFPQQSGGADGKPVDNPVAPESQESSIEDAVPSVIEDAEVPVGRSQTPKTQTSRRSQMTQSAIADSSRPSRELHRMDFESVLRRVAS